MPKNDKYEGVKLYSDVTKKSVRQDKKQLLKEMAMAGNAGMRALDDETHRSYHDRHNYDTEGSTPQIAQALNDERDRMMGGLEVARDMQGRAHSQEMDRLAARSMNYQDSIRHSGRLAGNASRERIAAMKIAQEARNAAASGGGGGGGSAGYPAPLDPNAAAEPALTELQTLLVNGGGFLAGQGWEDKDIDHIGTIMNNNPEATLHMNNFITNSLAEGHDFETIAPYIVRIGGKQGLQFSDAAALGKLLFAQHDETYTQTSPRRTHGNLDGLPMSERALANLRASKAPAAGIWTRASGHELGSDTGGSGGRDDDAKMTFGLQGSGNGYGTTP